MSGLGYKHKLVKADGRAMWLYSRQPIDPAIHAPTPVGIESVTPNPHLRWHPLRGEWVAYAGHRQQRTFLPPPAFNPLAPARDGGPPTELPAGAYDVAVFENRFPTLYAGAHDAPKTLVDTKPARGVCEVVVYAQDPSGSLGSLPLSHVELIVATWADRTSDLGARSDVEYVMPFENRGVEVGVTNHHPHGQIYAYPFIPPIAARELAMQREHFDRTGRGLLTEIIARECAEGTRLIYSGTHAVAFVPAFARYAYEVWIAPVRGVPRIDLLDDCERGDFARALKSTLVRLDALWSLAMPYVMVMHQAPSDGAPHPEAHVHLEIYPAMRMRGRLKFLAGSELGAGTFTSDTFPEEKAAELRALKVSLD